MVKKAIALWEPPQKLCLQNRSKPGNQPDPASVENESFRTETCIRAGDSSHKTKTRVSATNLTGPAILLAIAGSKECPKNGLLRVCMPIRCQIRLAAFTMPS